MTASTLDLLYLTFNCAKTIVNPAAFAHHLHDAFGQNATNLPEMLVLSLQEVAPMSYAFGGDYFFRPYLARFDEAVNLAAARYDAHGDAHVVSVTATPTVGRTYTLVRAHNVGYTALMLFARDPSRLRDLEEAEVGFGAAEMANKGAAGLRVRYDAGEGAETELTFVATHLAAMEWNLARRNANWAAIMRCLTFKNPETIIDSLQRGRAEVSGNEASGERVGLLQEEHDEEHARVRRELHEISVFKPSSHLFLAGDLNYRISTTPPPPGAAFPSMDSESENYFPNFLPLDQLTREKAAGRTLHGMSEAPITFPPTYKYDVLKGSSKDADDGTEEVPWKFAKHRYPSWTDRVLYLDVPSWITPGPDGKRPEMKVRTYNALPLMRSSDHRPVFLRVDVPLIAPADMAPPADLVAADPAAVADPRLRLPVEIDPEAWERRAAARRRELITGWSMFMGSTKEGAYILGSVLVASLGGYLLYRSM